MTHEDKTIVLPDPEVTIGDIYGVTQSISCGEEIVRVKIPMIVRRITYEIKRQRDGDIYGVWFIELQSIARSVKIKGIGSYDRSYIRELNTEINLDSLEKIGVKMGHNDNFKGPYEVIFVSREKMPDDD